MIFMGIRMVNMPVSYTHLPGDFTPSPFVEQITGVDNVCERAALASGGTLLRKKTTRDGVTVALAMEELHLTWKEHL